MSKKRTPKRPQTVAPGTTKPGATWWGRRWIEALEHLSRDNLHHLGRGRAYARAGHVHELKVEPGRVTATVKGESETHAVSVRVAVLSSAAWQKAIAALGSQAVFSAELLAGRMPAHVEDAFRATGRALFPARQHELDTDCSCEDWVGPCKHVAAVHYVLGAALDKDPFLLFELRGRTKQQILGALRTSRRTSSQDAAAAELVERLDEKAAQRRADSAALADRGADSVNPDDYERCPTPLPPLQFSVAKPTVSGALLKQLGPPPAPSNDGFLAALIPVVTAAAELARTWVLADSDQNRG
jgi:uncharacterized Zn finger protein